MVVPAFLSLPPPTSLPSSHFLPCTANLLQPASIMQAVCGTQFLGVTAFTSSGQTWTLTYSPLALSLFGRMVCFAREDMFGLWFARVNYCTLKHRLPFLPFTFCTAYNKPCTYYTVTFILLHTTLYPILPLTPSLTRCLFLASPFNSTLLRCPGLYSICI